MFASFSHARFLQSCKKKIFFFLDIFRRKKFCAQTFIVYVCCIEKGFLHEILFLCTSLLVKDIKVKKHAYRLGAKIRPKCKHRKLLFQVKKWKTEEFFKNFNIISKEGTYRFLFCSIFIDKLFEHFIGRVLFLSHCPYRGCSG